jgi:hypothetical protein
MEVVGLMRSTKMMWTGGLMAFGGWLLLFHIVLGHAPRTYFLNFFGYGVSFVGLLVALVGILDHIRPQR